LLAAVIAHQQIAVVFQPQINPSTGAWSGAEALRGGTVSRAPSSCCASGGRGLSERLSRRVQSKALRAASAWEGPLRRLRVSINLLADDDLQEGLRAWLLDEVDAAGIDPLRVTVEITENVLLSDLDSVGARCSAFARLGSRIALDDFGTGYASLSYLGTLPLDASEDRPRLDYANRHQRA
jgi:EAL domain-containing protein (putative c-di-GMP-specific phosphodiesterase class I)